MWREVGTTAFKLAVRRASTSAISTMTTTGATARRSAFATTPTILGSRTGVFLLGAGRVCGWRAVSTAAGFPLRRPLVANKSLRSNWCATVASSPKVVTEEEDGVALSTSTLEGLAKTKATEKVNGVVFGGDSSASANGVVNENGVDVLDKQVDGKDKSGQHKADSELDGFGPSIRKFRLSEATIKKLEEKEITHMTEVQAGTFDKLYDGHDVIARSRTGTGKTLAFALPILERMAIQKKEEGRLSAGFGPGCIVLAPTRELAKQVGREMAYFGAGLGLTCEVIYGGASYGTQERALRRGVDVVVGTPGRVIDHLTRGNLDLSRVSFAVLDEADEMLSMGFADDVETVFARLPRADQRQAILFSATVPSWVKRLAAKHQKPDVISFDSVSKGSSLAATTVRHCAICVPDRDEARSALLADIIAVYSNTIGGGTSSKTGRAIVFCDTKREADELATSGSLEGCGAAVLHGDVTQKQREITLAQFRKGRFAVLVATDVAARGLDISCVDLVVQYRIPDNNESYIHRAGRTGRAGRLGVAVIMHNEREAYGLRGIERDCGVKFERTSAPSPAVAMQALANATVTALDDVDAKVVEALLPKAQEILANGDDPAKQLARVLAVATRRTEMHERSLLSGETGMRTLRVQTKNRASTSQGFVVRFISELAERFGVERRVGLIRMCRDGSAVLDVPESAAEKLVEGCKTLETDEVLLDAVDKLPELAQELRSRGRYGGGGGGRRFDRNSRGGRSGGGGGRDFRGRIDGRFGQRDFTPRGRFGGGGGGGGGNERYNRGRSGFRGDRGHSGGSRYERDGGGDSWGRRSTGRGGGRGSRMLDNDF